MPSVPCPVGSASHRLYLPLATPTAPWSPPYWVAAFDFACGWASGATTQDQAAGLVTEHYNGSGMISYDTTDGATFYGISTFELGEMLERLTGGPGLGGLVNCTDSANTVTTLSNLLGSDLWESRMAETADLAGGFELNPIIAIGYNTQKLKEADAPKNWPDLLDPKWKDKIALGHPGFSGYVGTWVVTLKKLYGWDFFEKLAKNNPQVGRSINDTVTMLNAGERIVAGSGPVGTAMESAGKGNPLAMIYPPDGSVLIIAPSGIPKGVKHPNAAKLFMEYLLTTEASQIWVEHFNESMRPEVKPVGGAKSAADVKTIRPSVEEITKGIPEVIKQWRDTFGV